MTTQPRIALDDLTSDALDQLYERAEKTELDAEQQDRHFRTICGERESYRQAWKDEQKQRATAEARVRELEAAAAPTRSALRDRYTAAITTAYPDLRYVAEDLADKLCTVREPELARLRHERDQLQEALAAVTGQCRGLEAELVTARSTIDRVRELAGRYQMWHEGGWAPSSAADVAREYRAAVDG